MRRILSIALLLLIPISSSATDRNAATCSRDDVNTAMSAAVAGDRVVIPSGTCNWSTSLSWTAPANTTLIGAGTSATGGGDVTNIVDDYATNAAFFVISVANTGTFRMSGITLKGGTGVLKDGGLLSIGGPGNIRLDHMHFNTKTYSSFNNTKILYVGTQVNGVLDHNIFNLESTSAIYPFNGSSDKGNTTWTEATNFGGSNFIFIEDNKINGTPSSHDTRIVDCFTAGRYVIRFNTFIASSLSEQHATGHAPDDRGCRAHESYGNSLALGVGQTDPNYMLDESSSGTALIWGNDAGTDSVKNMFLFNVTRKNNDSYGQAATPTGWGYCGTDFNGTGSNWDENSSAGTGYACLDQTGRGPGDLLSGDFPNKLNNRTSTIAWPQQALEPIYFWKNTGTFASGWGGATYNNNTTTASGSRVVADRDYYEQASGIQTSSTSPFNGTTGTGWGTLTNRPTTCTSGVGYFATDQGSWNISSTNPEGVQQNGADGIFYKCTATNTWTSYYTPYTYPHPLQSGGSAPVVNGLTCSPTSIQSPSGTTSCTATTSSGTPTSWAWTVSSCTTPSCSTGDTTNPATFSCSYGGSCTICALAHSAEGDSNNYCTSAGYLTSKYRKPANFTAR